MSPPRFHVLLVGIDDYPVAPLQGCVNDVDAIQRLLVGRLGVPRDRIRRLVSPGPGTLHDTTVPERPATGAQLREALAELGSGEVADGDRVFVYYSGHGTQATVIGSDGVVFHREALVPVDVTPGVADSLVFDHELNAALARIVERTQAITVVLDCCHAAGVTRTYSGGLAHGPTGVARSSAPVARSSAAAAGAAARFMNLALDLGWTDPLRDPTPREAMRGHGLVRHVDACQVVSACLEHEVAYEQLGADGLRQGLFTRALVGALAGVRSEELGEVRWSRIWEALSAHIEGVRPGQHPRMAGSLARAVFSGAPVDGDPGFALARTGDSYLLHAGTLAGITKGAVVAVYGETTVRFAPLDSAADRAARLGVIRVASSTAASAVAFAEPAFELPRGARGRLVTAGTPARMACSVVPPDPAAVSALRASPLLDVVDDAGVKLVQVGGLWMLGDGLHEPTLASALTSVDERDLAGCRAILEHYFHYSLPSRMAERVRDLPGALELTVRACHGRVTPAAAQDAASLPEAASVGTGTYDLHSGDQVCFRIANTSQERLRVTLLNAASTGRVQWLGDHIVDANAAYAWWLGGALGRPFPVDAMPGQTQWIDRLTAIGTTALTKDLHHLRLESSFADAIELVRGGAPTGAKEFGGGDRAGPPIELWTATQVVVRVRAPRSPLRGA